MNEQNLEQLLNSGNFSAALTQLTAGEKLPKTIQDFNKAQILDNLFRAEQYTIINHFIKDKTIETDIYEFDKFDKSVFQSVVRHLKTDEQGLAFFREFISKFENLNDEVNSHTLLGYFLQQLASVELIEILIEAGCDVNFKNNAEENYIHQVVKNNQTKYSLDYEEQQQLQKAYIEILLKEGLEIDEENVVKKTPLICAIEFHKPFFLAFLLENGANPNHRDNTGNTAFFYAVEQISKVQKCTPLCVSLTCHNLISLIKIRLHFYLSM
ncbi:ankyrin repeat domain-containing protein [Pedobacter frigiditerrae]|uniref:ankyrin repeat domain-containing protein n=1 Tax=Pedobacter frigiditerrae TaxID=2530452 RepID=UPI002930D16D|nr:ankyrin repeat domain-containing protein [Pedobacter frigiditerrae]